MSNKNLFKWISVCNDLLNGLYSKGENRKRARFSVNLASWRPRERGSDSKGIQYTATQRLAQTVIDMLRIVKGLFLEEKLNSQEFPG